MDTFLVIEKVLNFHHLTTRKPLRVTQLRFRAFQNGSPISQSDIDNVLKIWPEAYTCYVLKGNLMIEALDLPSQAGEREAKFLALWSQKENSAEAKQIGNHDIPTNKQQVPVKPRLIGQLRTEIHMKTCLKNPGAPLSLLDRIRAKEARLKSQRSPSAVVATRDAFIRSQIPKLTRVLKDLVKFQAHKSLEMETVMDIMRTNLYKLSDDEIQRALELCAELYPDFCSIVKHGEQRHLTLRNSSVNVC